MPTTGPGDTQYYGPSADTWAGQGYAVLQLVARGFGDSCGSAQSRLADPTACQNGYIRLDDERYEARDAQYAIGLLVDEAVADPNRIGVTGESYGGGVSLELATLKDRVMNADGTLSPWTSPNGVALHVAAAAPVIPWSDLVYSLLPGGHDLDYAVTGPTADLGPLGVEKQSFVSGLYAEGSTNGYYAPAGTNSQADLVSWFADLNAGEPYDGNPQDEALAAQIAQYHSPYYLLDSAYGTATGAPSPLLIANGFTDDLFPVDEALRYYNLEHSLYPNDPISLPPAQSTAHPAPLCTARPYSRIDRRRTRASRRKITVSGTAGEHRCATAPPARWRLQRLARVEIMIYQPASHGRCRFLERSGRLSRPRPCGHPIEFLARGTSHWSLRLRIPAPPGHYLIRVDAVDRLHRHQRHTAVSVAGLRVR